MRPSRWSWRVLALLVFVWPGLALAQGDAAAAEILFREGREAMERGQPALACDKFAASYQLDPAAGTLINLAACFEAQGMTASAWEAWQRALARLHPADERVPLVSERLAAAEDRLSRLTVRLAPGAPSGTRVEKEGVALAAAALGVALPVDPGEYAVVVRAPGREPRVYRVVIEAERAKSLRVEPGPPLPAPPLAAADGSPASRHPPGRALRHTGLVLGGMGLVGLSAGAVAGLLALDDARTMDAECRAVDGDRYCSDLGLDAGDRGQTAALVSTVALSAGGATLLGGTLLIAAGRHRDRRTGGEHTAIVVRARF